MERGEREKERERGREEWKKVSGKEEERARESKGIN